MLYYYQKFTKFLSSWHISIQCLAEKLCVVVAFILSIAVWAFCLYILVQPKKINGESFIWRQWKALASIIYYFCVWIFTILYLCRWFPAAIGINDYFVYLIRIKIKEPVKMINQCIFIIHKYLKLNFSYILNSSFGATTHIHILAGITKNFRAKPFSSHSLYLWSLSQRWKTLHIHSHPYTQMNWSFW